MFSFRAPVLRAVRPGSATRCIVPARPFQSGAVVRAERQPEDRNTINTESREYSKSGGDEAAARATSDAAFSRDKTRPEEQLKHAEKEVEGTSKSNPLDASPANQDFSKPVKHTNTEGSKAESGNGESSGRARTSGGGSTPKNG